MKITDVKTQKDLDQYTKHLVENNKNYRANLLESYRDFLEAWEKDPTVEWTNKPTW